MTTATIEEAPRRQRRSKMARVLAVAIGLLVLSEALLVDWFAFALRGSGLSALEWLFKADVEPSQVAAIIIEPVQGEGGFYVAPQAFMERIREICTEHGIVMICDEVQTGFARTGKLLAIEHYGIEPDIIVMAKSLAGGYPLSAVSGRAEIMDAPDPGGLGSTFGGSPIGCAAALAVIEVIEDEDLCARAIQIGEHIKQRVQRLKERNDTPPIGDVRGLGAMIAFELVKERGAHDPDPAMAKALVTKAEANGLVILPCGVFGNTVRILVPLTASQEVVDEGLDIIERSLIEIAGA